MSSSCGCRRPATLVERIIEREPASWSGLPALVEHAQALARGMAGLAGVDLVLGTDGPHPEEVAERIRAALPSSAGANPRLQG
jgi:hypothetical protein